MSVNSHSTVSKGQYFYMHDSLHRRVKLLQKKKICGRYKVEVRVMTVVLSGGGDKRLFSAYRQAADTIGPPPQPADKAWVDRAIGRR